MALIVMMIMMVVVVVLMMVMVLVRMRGWWRMIMHFICGSTFVKRRLARRNDIGGGRWVVFALHKILNNFRCLLLLLVVMAFLRWSGRSRLDKLVSKR